MWQLTYAADLGPKAGCYWASNDVSIPKQWFEMNSSYATVFARIFNILAGQRSFFFEFTITCPVSFVLASFSDLFSFLTTTLPELKSELLITTWTLLNHRCSALATLWTWTALDWNWPLQNLTSVPLVGTQQASDLSPPWTLGLFLRSQFVRSVSQISGLFQLLKVAPSCL